MFKYTNKKVQYFINHLVQTNIYIGIQNLKLAWKILPDEIMNLSVCETFLFVVQQIVPGNHPIQSRIIAHLDS